MAVKTSKILIVHIGNHYFGAPIDNIQDVIQRQPTTPIPLAPRYIVGLLNLRGHIVTEIDVGVTLGIDHEFPIAKTDGYSIVITKGGELFSLVFEGIGDVVDLPDDRIERLPDTINKEWISMSKGVYRMDSKLVILLNFDALINQLIESQKAA